VYSFSSTVRYSECDERGRLSIPALVNYLQDCALFHTESLGHGINYIAQFHVAWYLAAWQIQIERRPVFAENLTVSTWCHSISTTLAGRSFCIANDKGEELVKADSLWFVFDTQRMRPVRVPKDEYVYLSDDERIDLPPTQRKLKVSGTGEAQGPVVVSEEHLDTNHHVNNGQYIAIADHIIRHVDEDFEPRTVLAQYKLAATLGDTMVPQLYREADGYAIDLAQPDGTTFAIVRMQRLEQKAQEN